MFRPSWIRWLGIVRGMNSFFILQYFPIFFPSVINLFDWSSLIDQGKDLKNVLRVPNLETGKMEPLITGDDDGALTAQEEEQFRNMVKRLHTIFKVR